MSLNFKEELFKAFYLRKKGPSAHFVMQTAAHEDFKYYIPSAEVYW